MLHLSWCVCSLWCTLALWVNYYILHSRKETTSAGCPSDKVPLRCWKGNRPPIKQPSLCLAVHNLSTAEGFRQAFSRDHESSPTQTFICEQTDTNKFGWAQLEGWYALCNQSINQSKYFRVV